MENESKALDVSWFTNPDTTKKKELVHQVGESLETLGFLTLRGLPNELLCRIKKAHQVARVFFALTAVQKQAYELDPKFGRERGYGSFGIEYAKDKPDEKDQKEYWSTGRDRYLENVWPTEIADFKNAMTNLYGAMDELAYMVLRIIALYLHFDEKALSDLVVDGDSVLRVIHYPAPKDGLGPQIIAGAHEDINLITLLYAPGKGLEVLDRQGNWLEFSPQPDELVVNTGDVLKLITNGRLPSTTHRVVRPEPFTEDRYSIPFFCHARREVLLKQGITSHAFVDERLRAIGVMT